MTPAPTVVVATRRSQLALAQTRQLATRLIEAHPGLEVSELHVVTTGDRIQDRPLAEIGGKGLFVKEIEQAVLDGRADFAVHSVKDIPGLLAPGLALACFPMRADPRDVFVSKSGERLGDVPPGTRLGTSSLRRATLLRKARPDLVFLPLRGNVDTRIRKVREGVVDATVLAHAGLDRLGRLHDLTEILDPEVCIPAVGQGSLGIECRSDDARMVELLSALHDSNTACAVAVERGVMIAVEGSCRIPIAAYARSAGEGRMRLHGMLATSDGSRVAFADETVPWPTDPKEADAFGQEVGARLKEQVG